MGLKINLFIPRAGSLRKFTTTGQMDMLELDIHQCQTERSLSSMLDAIFAREGDWT